MKTYKKILSYLLIATIGLGVIFGVMPMMAYADDNDDISWASTYMSNYHPYVTPEYVDDLTPVNVKDVIAKKINDAAPIAGKTTGFYITITHSDDETVVDSDGNVLFNTDPLRSCTVDYEINKGTGTPVSRSITVKVLSKTLYEAKAFILGQEPIETVFGSDTSIVTKINDIISSEFPESGISTYIFNSSEMGTIDSYSGNITYGPVEKNVNVSMNFNEGQDAYLPVSFSVTVPTFSDGQVISYAKSILGDFHNLSQEYENGPIQGRDRNILPVMQRYVDTFVTGVEVALELSNNSNVDGDTGAIFYGDSEITGNVHFTLSKGDASEPVTMSTTVPAEAVSDEEKMAVITTAISWKSTNGGFSPIDGADLNAKAMILDEVNYWLPETSGIIINSFTSNDTDIITDEGEINYDVTQHDVAISLGIQYGELQAELLNNIMFHVPESLASELETIAGQIRDEIGTLQPDPDPDEGLPDTNVVDMIQTYLTENYPNVTVSDFSSGNLDNIAANGDIIYNDEKEVTVHFKLLKYEIESSLIDVSVFLPDYISGQIALAKSAVQMTPFNLAQGTDSSANTQLQARINAVTSGVTVKTFTSDTLANIANDGTVIYNNAKTVTVTIVLTKGGTDSTSFDITYSLPEYVSGQIAIAESNLSGDSNVTLVQGIDSNAKTQLQDRIDAYAPGISVYSFASNNLLNIGNDGVITYNDSKSVTVEITLEKDGVISSPITITYSLPDYIPGQLLLAKTAAMNTPITLVQGTDISANTQLQARVNAVSTGVTVKTFTSDTTANIANDGTITYNNAKTVTVTVVLTKGGTDSASFNVTYSLPDYIPGQLLLAKTAAMNTPITLVQGTDSSANTQLQARINAVTSGVTVKTFTSDTLANIANDGTVTYNNAKTVTVTIVLTKGGTDSASFDITYSLPDYTLGQLALAKSAVEMTSFDLVQGTDSNAKTQLQALINSVTSGVTVESFISNTLANIANDGTITYNNAKTVTVTIVLTKGGTDTTSFEITYSLPDYTLGQLELAKSAVEMTPFNLAQGTDSSANTQLQTLINSVTSGVTVKSFSSDTLANIANDGTITYNNAKIVTVTIVLTKGGTDSASFDITYSVPDYIPGQIQLVTDELGEAPTFSLIGGTDTNAKTKITQAINAVYPSLGVVVSSFAPVDLATIEADGNIIYSSGGSAQANIKLGKDGYESQTILVNFTLTSKSTAPSLSDITVISNGGPNDIFQIRNLEANTTVKVYFDSSKENLLHTFGPESYQIASWTLHTDFGSDLAGSFYVTVIEAGKLESNFTEITYVAPEGISTELSASDLQSSTNVYQGYEGGIIVKNITGGDIVKVYDSLTEGNLLSSEMLSLSNSVGDKEIFFTTLPTNKKVYVSIVRKGKFESIRREFSIKPAAFLAVFDEIRTGLATLQPITLVKGTNSNAIAKLQSLIDSITPDSGVTIKQFSVISGEDNVQSRFGSTGGGEITYDNEATASVAVTLEKDEVESDEFTVILDLTEDIQGKLIAAKAKLSPDRFSTLYEGDISNIVSYAQYVVNTRVSGVHIDLLSNENCRINSETGYITYGAKCIAPVTFELSIGGLTDTVTVEVNVPESLAVTPKSVESAIQSNNYLLVGDYAFSLDSDGMTSGYNQRNFTQAMQEATEKGLHVYYKFNGQWYDVMDDPTLSNPISAINVINGTGLFKFLNMNVIEMAY